ncbi:MAG: LysE family transporter, partial [Janthinobacterium sp.]
LPTLDTANATLKTHAWRAALQRGLLTNLLNPKALLFCSVLLPQFIDPQAGPVAAQFALLGVILVAVGFAFDCCYALAGARIGMGTAFIVVIVAEMIAVNSGLGFRILEAREYFWSDKIIAGMFTIGLFGLAIDIAMNALNNHLLQWHRGLEH